MVMCLEREKNIPSSARRELPQYLYPFEHAARAGVAVPMMARVTIESFMMNLELTFVIFVRERVIT